MGSKEIDQGRKQREKIKLPKGVRQHIRDLKAQGRWEEADRFREEIINKIREKKKKIEEFKQDIRERIFQDDKDISFEEAKIRVSKIEGIPPEERQARTLPETVIKGFWREIKELPPLSDEIKTKRQEMYSYLHFLSLAYPADFEYMLEEVNGGGKTRLVECRDAVIPQRVRS
jgi:hypothetical protein